MTIAGTRRLRAETRSLHASPSHPAPRHPEKVLHQPLLTGPEQSGHPEVRFLHRRPWYRPDVPLVDCPDCGNPISTEAYFCPKCGRPTGKQKAAPRKLAIRTLVIWVVLVLAFLAVWLLLDPQ